MIGVIVKYNNTFFTAIQEFKILPSKFYATLLPTRNFAERERGFSRTSASLGFFVIISKELFDLSMIAIQ